MVSRIDIGPDGGPYVEIDEDAGDLVIRVPSNTVDFDSNDLLNAVLQNATMDGGSLDGVSLASALDANNQDLNSVGTASVTALEADDAVVDDSLTATGLDQSSSPTNPIRFLGHGSQSKKTEFWTVEREIDADNEPHDLLDVEDAPTGMMVVVARRDPPSNFAFCDIVLVARSTSQSILGSQQRQDVGPRSYSNDSTMQQIAIDEPGEWYQVNVHWIGGTA